MHGETNIGYDLFGHSCTLYRVSDGEFVRDIASGLHQDLEGVKGWKEGGYVDGPTDVEEVDGGWVVACGYNRVEFVADGAGDDGGGRPSLGKAGGGYGSGDGEFNCPSALAVVPGLGLVVRELNGGRLQVFG